ncbi:MAG: hypothetical protein EOO73_10650 [Myxococcales bacterium]|nr:MAG: hypothetical protein EOO73_10650 [Myxococcales bacterium]
MQYAHVACSSECLRAHQRTAHEASWPADTATRAGSAQQLRNRRSKDVWELFASHRERLMSLIPPGTEGGTLCVLGAGKCDDLDLARLARQFARVHLVDLDGEAMERARDRQPAAVREVIELHPGLDLSGLLERLDAWGDEFPDDAALHEAVSRAAHRVAGALGGPFNMTLSTCVLSQLIVPFQNAWAAPASTWCKLSAALTAVHAGVLARATAAGGATSLVFDVLSSEDAPWLLELKKQTAEQLQVAVDSRLRPGKEVLEPDPSALLAHIRDSGIATQSPAPHLTRPWLWDTGTALHLVYALSFRRS